MTSQSVAFNSSTAQAAFEFVSEHGGDGYTAIVEALDRLGVSDDERQAIIDACCVLEQMAFHSGFVMAECLKSVPLMGR